MLLTSSQASKLAKRYDSLFFLVGVDNVEVRNPLPATARDFAIWVELVARGMPSAGYLSCVVLRAIAQELGLPYAHPKRNEVAILEFIHLLVETMDRHFGNVCELDIMFHLEKAHFMLEEMVMNGCIIETSKANIVTPIQLMDKAS
ncbi:hypothetical protein RND71_008240 [Anisodus tanguticus]|uniref:AP complex mu/sigma subunit domain-containing protein n=1 Tax=Anisodus tanguticus TaxID=243964 RepID=A0AAE1SNG9_9SOLA|nr:hypothetical protein RND71_008240 [Anisodus tanguticus]